MTPDPPPGSGTPTPESESASATAPTGTPRSTAARSRVKVCGVTSPRDRELVVAAGADALGVVCGVPVETPREVSLERARELLAGTPPFVTATLVTMPGDAAAGARLIEQVRADAVQVHGLGAEAIADLRDRTAATVVAAADAGTPREELTVLADAADAVHLDSTDEAGAGGTGRTHDWERARELVASIDAPVALAGGLTPDNVATAVRTVGPYAVDAASGTEPGADADVDHSAGQKDADRVRTFVARATAADPGGSPDDPARPPAGAPIDEEGEEP